MPGGATPNPTVKVHKWVRTGDVITFDEEEGVADETMAVVDETLPVGEETTAVGEESAAEGEETIAMDIDTSAMAEQEPLQPASAIDSLGATPAPSASIESSIPTDPPLTQPLVRESTPAAETPTALEADENVPYPTSSLPTLTQPSLEGSEEPLSNTQDVELSQQVGAEEETQTPVA